MSNDYELDYNLGTFVLVSWASKSETSISPTEAMTWATRSNVSVTSKANQAIDHILEEMQAAV